MGGHAWYYVVPLGTDLKSTLTALREREFRAGRYNPVIWFPSFPVEPDSPAPGAQHKSIAVALKASNESGTRSILDIDRIADEPRTCTASPIRDDRLLELYGTTRPTRAMVEENMDFFEEIERGEARYILIYDGERPVEVCFAGYSFD